MSSHIIAVWCALSLAAPPPDSEASTDTYTKPLPPEASTEPYWEGGILWNYEGQQEYSVDPQPIQPTIVSTEAAPDPAERTLSDIFLGTVRVDSLGRRWVAADVDTDVLTDKLDAHQQTVLELFGPEPDGPPETQASIAEEQSTATEALWTPYGWDWENCDSDPGKEVGVWNAPSRQDSLGNLDRAPRKNVMLFLNNQRHCNGTVVDPRRILTAAHCVHDNNGYVRDKDDLTVCTYGNMYPNATCQDIDHIWVNTAYNHLAPDPGEDYAVLATSGLLGVGWTAISSAPDSVIESNPIHRTAHPYYRPGANDMCDIEPTELAENYPPYHGGRLYIQWGEINLTPNKVVCSRHDASVGESGSAFYYFTTGSYDFHSTDPHYIVGIVSGAWECGFWGVRHIMGPKAHDFKTWVEGTFP